MSLPISFPPHPRRIGNNNKPINNNNKTSSALEIIAAMAPTLQLTRVMVCILFIPIQLIAGLSVFLGSKKVGRVSAGPIDISSLGCGTWSWGNRLLWDYDPSQDEEIYRAYRAIRNAGVTIFDTADSYGTLELNGRAEILLGQFERRYQEENIGSSSKSNIFGLGSLLTGDSDTARKRNKQQVATKFAPYPWRITRESLVQAARESLKRLDQDSKWDRRKYVLIIRARNTDHIIFLSFQNCVSHSCIGQRRTTNPFKKVR